MRSRRCMICVCICMCECVSTYRIYMLHHARRAQHQSVPPCLQKRLNKMHCTNPYRDDSSLIFFCHFDHNLRFCCTVTVVMSHVLWHKSNRASCWWFKHARTLFWTHQNALYPIFTFLRLSLKIIPLKENNWDLVSIVTEKFTLLS